LSRFLAIKTRCLLGPSEPSYHRIQFPRAQGTLVPKNLGAIFPRFIGSLVPWPTGPFGPIELINLEIEVPRLQDIKAPQVPRRTGGNKSSHPDRLSHLGTLSSTFIGRVGSQTRLISWRPGSHGSFEMWAPSRSSSQDSPSTKAGLSSCPLWVSWLQYAVVELVMPVTLVAWYLDEPLPLIPCRPASNLGRAS